MLVAHSATQTLLYMALQTTAVHGDYSSRTCEGVDTSMNILIDPGHGGKDHGAVYSGVRESDVTWKVAQKVLDFLGDAMDERVNLYMSRGADHTISLADRAQVGRAVDADLCVHIHADARPNSPSSHGLHTYYWPGNDRMLKLGQMIQRIAPDRLYKRTAKPYAAHHHEKWLSRTRYVLSKMHCDAILVELGFLTNENDREFMSSDIGVAMMAMSLTTSLSDYIISRNGLDTDNSRTVLAQSRQNL